MKVLITDRHLIKIINDNRIGAMAVISIALFFAMYFYLLQGFQDCNADDMNAFLLVQITWILA